MHKIECMTFKNLCVVLFVFIAVIPASSLRIFNPLAAAGYKPPVDACGRALDDPVSRPVVLFLPGFDGSILTSFLQFPTLDDFFDVRVVDYGMDDTSFDEITSFVSSFIAGNPNTFIVGESFGGLVGCWCVGRNNNKNNSICRGLILVNPATSFMRSELRMVGTEVAGMNPLFYNFGLLKLLPLLGDGQQIEDFLNIVNGNGLPKVIDTPAKEAYLGRVAAGALGYPPYMSKEMLRHRLVNWLEAGCWVVDDKLLQGLETKTLIVAGEIDRALPSVEEAERLQQLMGDVEFKVVQNAGHAGTLGSRINLAAAIYDRFGVGLKSKGAAQIDGIFPRLEMGENMRVSMSPLKYWDPDVYVNTTS